MHEERVGNRIGVYGALVRKTEGKRPFGRPRTEWKDNIKIDFQEVGCEAMEWIDLPRDLDGWQAL